MMTTLPTITKKETTALIDGPAGKLELITSDPIGERKGAFAVVCHPHPLYGGTMHNKVVTTLCKTFQTMGAYTVRFNFRGVMLSEGQYDQGVGELGDLLAVIDWVSQQHPKHDIWLGGFSFGGCIAARGAVSVPAKKLVTVAPAIHHFPLTDLPPIRCRWALVQGDLDDVVPPKEVLAWADSLDPKPTIIRFPDAGHYFHGLLSELRLRVEEVLA